MWYGGVNCGGGCGVVESGGVVVERAEGGRCVMGGWEVCYVRAEGVSWEGGRCVMEGWRACYERAMEGGQRSCAE